MNKIKFFIKKFFLFFVRLNGFNSEIVGVPKQVVTLENWIKNTYKTYSSNYLAIYEEKIIIEKNPFSIYEDINWRFMAFNKRKQPAAYVMKFNNARVFDTKGFIITENDNVIIELSREFSQNKYTIFNRFSLGKLSKYNNCVAVLTTAGANVYYHWLFDILPRIHLLKESGIFEKIRYFILPELKFDFQKQSLRLLNFPLEKIIEIKSNQQIKADFLFVPSLPSLLGTVNQWSVDFIRNSFLNKNDIISNRKLYISRKNAVGRKVENEQLLTNLLKKYNFEIIDPGSMTFDEQIKTFASASHVISPHGSGLSNIVFCNPGCIIVDIFPPSFIIPCFWILSNKLSHNYYYFIGEGEVENEFTDYWNSKNSDINIDLDKFQILLNKINLEPPCSISHS